MGDVIILRHHAIITELRALNRRYRPGDWSPVVMYSAGSLRLALRACPKLSKEGTGALIALPIEAAKKVMCMKRKQQMESIPRTTIAALGSRCPRCGSNEVRAQGPEVTMVWVGLTYRFELPMPISYCSLCQHTFTMKLLQACRSNPQLGPDKGRLS